jgi:ankyrin repeat protein
LYRYAASGNWDLIPARCQSHPKEAHFQHKYPPNDTALHKILRPITTTTASSNTTATAVVTECHKNQCDCSHSNHGTTTTVNADEAAELQVQKTLIEWKLAAVDALLRADRQLATLPDSFGRTPLHLACMDDDEGGGYLAAVAILRANGYAASVTDQEHRTALHFLLARNNHIPIQLLTLLLQLHPKAVLQRDIVNETPIDIVERRREEIVNATEVLEMLQHVSLQNLDNDVGAEQSK